MSSLQCPARAMVALPRILAARAPAGEVWSVSSGRSIVWRSSWGACSSNKWAVSASSSVVVRLLLPFVRGGLLQLGSLLLVGSIAVVGPDGHRASHAGLLTRLWDLDRLQAARVLLLDWLLLGTGCASVACRPAPAREHILGTVQLHTRQCTRIRASGAQAASHIDNNRWR